MMETNAQLLKFQEDKDGNIVRAVISCGNKEVDIKYTLSSGVPATATIAVTTRTIDPATGKQSWSTESEDFVPDT